VFWCHAVASLSAKLRLQCHEVASLWAKLAQTADPSPCPSLRGWGV
jgi:hypothetical protein